MVWADVSLGIVANNTVVFRYSINGVGRDHRHILPRRLCQDDPFLAKAIKSLIQGQAQVFENKISFPFNIESHFCYVDKRL